MLSETLFSSIVLLQAASSCPVSLLCSKFSPINPCLPVDIHVYLAFHKFSNFSEDVRAPKKKNTLHESLLVFFFFFLTSYWGTLPQFLPQSTILLSTLTSFEQINTRMKGVVYFTTLTYLIRSSHANLACLTHHSRDSGKYNFSPSAGVFITLRRPWIPWGQKFYLMYLYIPNVKHST